ncbi:MAG TPA: DUF5926 family protein [Actinomycetes bacterium]|nr:DUF5926 family protein [Actinomycetes bacterium]
MSKRRAPAPRPTVGETVGVPAVGAREPCPCGSGRRYKACHGRDLAHADQHLVERPFEGLPGETDWVALREIVPAATAPLHLAGDLAGRTATLSTVLPLAWPAMVRTDGQVFVGLQVHSGSGDVSRDVAAALLRALDAEPGTPIAPQGLPGPGPRLQDVLDLGAALLVEVRGGFDFWLEGMPTEDAEGGRSVDAETRASMDRANAAVVPTERLTSVEAAYLARMAERSHLRWVLPDPEEALLDALARLKVAGGLDLGPDGRYVGAFRAHGLVVPVWDLPAQTYAEAVEQPALDWRARLDDALAAAGPLTDEQRRARGGLVSRQLTLR